MAMSFKFPHSVDDVFALMTDPDFLANRCIELGELSAECEVEESEDGEVVVRMTREVVRDLPSFLASMFNPQQTMELEEHWRDDGEGKSGSYTVTVVDQPVTLSAKFSLQPTADGCEYTIEHSAKAKIMLVGKQVEKFIIGQTGEGAKKEMEVLRRALAGE